jgi:hypothetical protein
MKKFAIGLNCKILSFCHVTNMGVSTTEMNSNMWSVLTNSKSADFIISMLHCTSDVYILTIPNMDNI